MTTIDNNFNAALKRGAETLRQAAQAAREAKAEQMRREQAATDAARQEFVERYAIPEWLADMFLWQGESYVSSTGWRIAGPVLAHANVVITARFADSLFWKARGQFFGDISEALAFAEQKNVTCKRCGEEWWEFPPKYEYWGGDSTTHCPECGREHTLAELFPGAFNKLSFGEDEQ
jgi:hypothetical protein